jgi:cyanophycinase
MTGTIALQGGGPFAANDELDTRLLSDALSRAKGAGEGGGGRVVVLPTADAYEHPERLVAAAMSWAERIGAVTGSVEVEALMVMRRGEALEKGAADVVRRARAVYLVGDQPLHLRSVLKDTPVWDAMLDVLAAGGLVVATGGSADALCDPMIDPRGGAFTLGLGLVTGLALVTEAETWSPERLHRTLVLANTPVACLPTGAALVVRDGVWEQVGEVAMQGELPRHRAD